MTFLNVSVSLWAMVVTVAAYCALKYLPPGLYWAHTVRNVSVLFGVAQAGFATHMVRMVVQNNDRFTGGLVPVLYVCLLSLLVVNHFGRARYYVMFTQTFPRGRPVDCTIEQVVAVMRTYTKLYPGMPLYAAKGQAMGYVALKVGKNANKTVALILLTQGRHIELFQQLAADFFGLHNAPQWGSPTQVALTYDGVDDVWQLEDASAGPVTAGRRFLGEDD